MFDPNKVSEEKASATFISRFFAHDALKRGVAAAATGAILAAIMVIAWPEEQ